MKNKLWIVTAAMLLAVIVSALVFYPMLSEKYLNEGDGLKGDKRSTAESADKKEIEEINGNDVTKTADFTVYSTELEEVRLSEFFGKPIVVNFWASWCGPCESELPAFDSMYEKYKDSVVFLMVNLTDGYHDTFQHVKKYVSDNGYGFPVYFDISNDASDTYGVYSIPETLFINADGTLHGTRIGSLSEAVLEDYINILIGAKK